MRKLVFVGVTLLLWCPVPAARGVVILSDYLSYTNGPLVDVSTNLWGTNVWAHTSGSITGEVQVVSGRAFLTQTNSEDVSVSLGQTYPVTTNTFLYASFTINFARLPSGAGDYFAHFKSSSSSGFHDKIYATTNGVPAGFFRIGVANSDNSAPSVIVSSNLSLNTDYMLVTRYAPSNAASTLWLNPAVETDFSVTASDAATASSENAFGLRENDNIGALYFDNLMIATSFAEVVPTVPPTITTGPQSQTVISGTNVTFTVLATGSSPLSYQWYFNLTNALTDQTNSTLALTSVTTNQSGIYTVTIANAAGSTNSDPAVLVVNPPPPPVAPFLLAQPQSQAVAAGSSVSFTAVAGGSAPLSYQWQFYGTNLPGATASTLVLNNVATNQAGPYAAVITNAAGSTNSQSAVLTVNQVTVVSVLTYNVKGTGASDWSTNSAQVQAIGHQMQYLAPDIITFQEIPIDLAYEMTNFVNVFLPGYFLVTSSTSDGFTRSSIASRFPITRAQSWLAHADLNPFGYTNSNFTRDLYEAQISVPNFNLPLHVFTVHLKSGSSSDEIAKRNAEGLAVSNYFVTVFLTTNASHPFLLTGDMNETDTNQVSIQSLISPPTGLQFTTPVNPFTGSALTFSIQAASLTKRFDYFMPSRMLYTNILNSQIFRTDLLPNPPAPLLTNDDSTASDHLPVMMSFSNPFNQPFRLLSISLTNQVLILDWESAHNRSYRLDASSNLAEWIVFASGLSATGTNRTFTTNVTDNLKFFRVYRVP